MICLSNLAFRTGMLASAGQRAKASLTLHLFVRASDPRSTLPASRCSLESEAPAGARGHGCTCTCTKAIMRAFVGEGF